ncbi:hypothetical protein [Staphylococcus phage PT94]
MFRCRAFVSFYRLHHYMFRLHTLVVAPSNHF